MAVNHGSAASWALAMGVLLAAVAGTLVTARTPGRELRYIAGFAVLFVPSLYAVIVRRWDHWIRYHPFVRFVVLFLAGFAAIVVLGLVARTALPDGGVLAGVVEVLAGIAGFAVAVWFTFYGGADRLWDELLDGLGIDW